MVAELRRCAESGPSAPRVVCVFQASVEEGTTFFASRWPEVVGIADPHREIYAAFGLTHAKWYQMLAPRVFWRALQATLRGQFVGRPVGDVRTMPGAFVVLDGAVVHEHEFRDVSDHPDFCAMADAAGTS